jgi:hypothetical protein
MAIPTRNSYKGKAEASNLRQEDCRCYILNHDDMVHHM